MTFDGHGSAGQGMACAAHGGNALELSLTSTGHSLVQVTHQ